MKRLIMIIIIIVTINTISNAYSKDFLFKVDTIGQALENEQGYELNEDIYNQYNQFVYGNPLDIKSGQRWKDVTNGRWTKNGSAWNGTGTRGEYWVLGFDYSGNEIHNHKFPVDIEPPTPPTAWRYVPLADARASWNDQQKYLHEEQREYMKTVKLTRNDIVYDLTAEDIGFDKARAENYATWTTNGNIYTRRYDMNNKEWAANFIVPPMAAGAELVSKLDLKYGEEYTIEEGKDEIEIPLTYGAEMINLNQYAKAEHVKLLKSSLYVNENIKSKVEGKQKIKVDRNDILIINKNNYQGKNKIELEVTVKSVLLTEFTVDGALTDTITKTIIIYLGEKEEELPDREVKNTNVTYNPEKAPPRITEIELKRKTVKRKCSFVKIKKR